jgi:hypothetical protein
MHLAAFGGAKTDSTANQNIPAVIDNALVTSANARYIAPSNVQVVAAMVANDTITRARITAPSLRQEGLPEVFPLTAQDAQPANPIVCLYDNYGPSIRGNEEFGVEASNGASTIDRAHAWLVLRDRMSGVPNGKRMRIVGTSAQTLLLDGWTLGGITLDQVLPFGTYAVIGMACVCTAAFGARLVFPQGGMWRPGCPVSPTVGQVDHNQAFLAGKLGEWGRFPSIAQPQLELIGTTAGAQTATVILDLVQVSLSA